GDVIVENTIQNATVTAGGDVIVKRGILTRAKGVVSAQGDVYARFIENSIVEAEGNIIVETAILNSRVSCNGRVVALTDEGSVIGGRVMAFDRVACRYLGSIAHPTTIVQVGYRHEVQQKYLEQLARLHTVQKQIKEIQKNYSYISKADSNDIDRLGELRGRMIKLIKIHDQMKEDITELNNGRIFNEFASVEVEQTVFPGVSIFVGDGRYPIKKDTKYASFKWDGEEKSIYLSSFDETGQGLVRTGAGKAKTVLIIDDSKAVRKTLRMIVEKMGLRVLDEAEDGQIGIEKYRQLRPTLVTCDIAMVNLNGVDTLKAIRNENPRARIVMISSNQDKKQILECIMSGARDYILKPFVPSRVVTVIKNALES
ncbi:MAG TPA: FapA family protein, partial [bacterium]|nr:FapA family protein [bacterium]